jgi:hypothetical protein
MSKINKKTKPHKYLVCAIYNSKYSKSILTRIEHVGIVLAHSPFSALNILRRDHNPDGEKPSKYVASRILGAFRVNMFSDQTYTCKELLSIRKG